MLLKTYLPRGGSLAQRLLIGAGLWSLIVLFGGAFALSALYRAEAVELLEEELDATLMALTRAVEVGPRGAIVADRSRLPADPRYETALAGRYWAIVQVDADDAPLMDIRADSLEFSELPLPVEIAEAALANLGETFFADTDGPAEGERIRLAVRAVVLSEAGARIVIMAAADRGASDAGARRFLFSIIIAMIFLAGGVLLAMALQVREVLKPLGRIQGDLAEIRAGQRTQLSGEYPAEVRPLTEELNKLIDHNRAVVERARTHVGNLAHALKTPLAVLRNEAGGSTPLDDVVRRQTEAMHGNVQHYLKRAQAAARAQSLGARTPIAPVAGGLVRLLNRLFAEKRLNVSADLPPELVFRGETQDLEEMLGNLMENACKWARARVVLTATLADDQMIELNIDDDGDGLGPDQREAALQRGVRLDETAPGTGLGLSIVTELAELYGGSLSLLESPVGGLRAQLRLPAA
ncbi:MAG: sensor histidine kinase [Pseudomonadota bacterium]